MRVGNLFPVIVFVLSLNILNLVFQVENFPSFPKIEAAHAQQKGQLCENGYTFWGGDAGDDANWSQTGCFCENGYTFWGGDAGDDANWSEGEQCTKVGNGEGEEGEGALPGVTPPREGEPGLLPVGEDGGGLPVYIAPPAGLDEENPESLKFIDDKILAAESESPNLTAQYSSLILDEQLPIEYRREAARIIAPVYGIAENDPQVVEKVAQKLRAGAEVFEVKTDAGSVYCPTRDCGIRSGVPGVPVVQDKGGIAPNPTYYEVAQVADGDKAGKPYVTVKQQSSSKMQVQAIQKAIDEVALRGGGVVYLPRGFYILNESIKLRDNVSLIGAGINDTIIKMENGFKHENAGLIKNESRTQGNIVIRDLQLNGADDDPPEHDKLCTSYGGFCTAGLELSGLTGVVVSNVHISGFSHDGIVISEQQDKGARGVRSSKDIRLSKVRVTKNGRNGVSLVDAANVVIDNSQIKENALSRDPGGHGVGVGQLVFEPDAGQEVSKVRIIETKIEPGKVTYKNVIFIYDEFGGKGSVRQISICDPAQASLIMIPRTPDKPIGEIVSIAKSSECRVDDIPSAPNKGTVIAGFDFFDFLGIVRKASAAEDSPYFMDSNLYELRYKTAVMSDYKQLYGNLTDLFLLKIVNENVLDQEMESFTNGELTLKTSKTGIFVGKVAPAEYVVTVDSIPGYTLSYDENIEVKAGEKTIIAIGVSKNSQSQRDNRFSNPLMGLDVLNNINKLFVKEASAQDSEGDLAAVVFGDINRNRVLDQNEEILPWAKLAINLQPIPLYKIFVP